MILKTILLSLKFTFWTFKIIFKYIIIPKIKLIWMLLKLIGRGLKKLYLKRKAKKLNAMSEPQPF